MYTVAPCLPWSPAPVELGMTEAGLAVHAGMRAIEEKTAAFIAAESLRRCAFGSVLTTQGSAWDSTRECAAAWKSRHDGFYNELRALRAASARGIFEAVLFMPVLVPLVWVLRLLIMAWDASVGLPRMWKWLFWAVKLLCCLPNSKDRSRPKPKAQQTQAPPDMLAKRLESEPEPEQEPEPLAGRSVWPVGQSVGDGCRCHCLRELLWIGRLAALLLLLLPIGSWMLWIDDVCSLLEVSLPFFFARVWPRLADSLTGVYYVFICGRRSLPHITVATKRGSRHTWVGWW